MTSIAFFLWLLSISQANWKSGEYGLIHSLTPVYFIAVGLLTVGFILALFHQQNWKMLFTLSIILIAFLKITPILIEGTGRPSWGRFNYGFVDYVLREGHVSSELIYHNWPSFSVLSAVFIQITGFTGREHLLMLSPFLLDVLLLIILLFFCDTILDNGKKKWMLVWLFFFANWVGQDYFAPQTVAYILYFMMLAIVFKLKQDLKARKARFTVLVLLLAALVTVHSLTPIFLLFVLFSLFIVGYSRDLRLFLFSAFLFVSWTVFGSETFLESSLIKYMPSINLSLFIQENVFERLSGSVAHKVIGYSRIIFSLVILFTGLIGFVKLWKSRRKIDRRVIGCLIGPLIVSSFLSYGGEMLFRIYIFLLIPCLYFTVQNLDSKKIAPLIFVVLIISPFFHVVTYYGTEIYEHVSLAEIKGADFFYDIGPHDSLVICRDITLNFKNIEQYEYIYFRYHNITWKNDALVLHDVELYERESYFIWLTETDKFWFDFYVGDSLFISDVSAGLGSRFNKIYSNPNFELYSNP
jgi:hypothetical protein